MEREPRPGSRCRAEQRLARCRHSLNLQTAEAINDAIAGSYDKAGSYPWLLLPDGPALSPSRGTHPLPCSAPAHSPAMRVLCCRACSSSSTCCSREACPWGLASPSSATPSRQPGIEDVLMNLPVSAPPCRRDWRACLSASCCVDSLGEAWDGEGRQMREGPYIAPSPPNLGPASLNYPLAPSQPWGEPPDLSQGLRRTKAPAGDIEDQRTQHQREDRVCAHTYSEVRVGDSDRGLQP